MILIMRPCSEKKKHVNDETTANSDEEVLGNRMVRFRDCLYDILIYNLDGLECIWYIFQYFVRNEIMDDAPRMSHLLYKLSVIFKQFGNNYRSIFHLENAIFSMMSSQPTLRVTSLVGDGSVPPNLRLTSLVGMSSLSPPTLRENVVKASVGMSGAT